MPIIISASNAKKFGISGNKPSKWGNKKTVIDGFVFDSRKEARRYSELKILEKAGKIKNLRLQVPFELVPSQYEDCEDVYTKGKNKGEKKKGKCLEKAVVYIADFVYELNGEMVVEDTKGFKTKDYIIKRKLMLFRYGIRVMEI